MNKTAACYIIVTEYQINIKGDMFNLVKLTRTGSLSIKNTIRRSSIILSSMD